MDRRTALRKTTLLAGTVLGAPTLASLLQSCQKQDRLSWTPQFLSTDQARFVSAFVDFLLPRTETPGGLDVKTDIFLDLVFAKLYDEAGQQQVVAEIDAFNADCRERFGSDFADLSAEDKTEVFRSAEAATATFNPGVWGTAVGEQEPVGFYRQLKSTVLWGYFSSEEIGLNYLNYDPIPGEYRGCIPLDEVGGKNWSL
jgi:hypothetical protein